MVSYPRVLWNLMWGPAVGLVVSDLAGSGALLDAGLLARAGQRQCEKI